MSRRRFHEVLEPREAQERAFAMPDRDAGNSGAGHREPEKRQPETRQPEHREPWASFRATEAPVSPKPPRPASAPAQQPSSDHAVEPGTFTRLFQAVQPAGSPTVPMREHPIPAPEPPATPAISPSQDRQPGTFTQLFRQVQPQTEAAPTVAQTPHPAASPFGGSPGVFTQLLQQVQAPAVPEVAPPARGASEQPAMPAPEQAGTFTQLFQQIQPRDDAPQNSGKALLSPAAAPTSGEVTRFFQGVASTNATPAQGEPARATDNPVALERLWTPIETPPPPKELAAPSGNTEFNRLDQLLRESEAGGAATPPNFDSVPFFADLNTPMSGSAGEFTRATRVSTLRDAAMPQGASVPAPLPTSSLGLASPDRLPQVLPGSDATPDEPEEASSRWILWVLLAVLVVGAAGAIAWFLITRTVPPPHR